MTAHFSVFSDTFAQKWALIIGTFILIFLSSLVSRLSSSKPRQSHSLLLNHPHAHPRPQEEEEKEEEKEKKKIKEEEDKDKEEDEKEEKKNNIEATDSQ
jgi:hypothetical protein